MEAMWANPALSAAAHPVLMLAFLAAEAIVFRIAYRAMPIARVGAWALLSTVASLVVEFLLRSRTGPSAMLTSFLASVAAGYVAVALAARLRPPPLLLRVVILATAALYAADLVALRSVFR